MNTQQKQAHLRQVIQNTLTNLNNLHEKLKDSPRSFQSHVDHAKGYGSGCLDTLGIHDCDSLDLAFNFYRDADLMAVITYANAK